jgi:hypothetical protein
VSPSSTSSTATVVQIASTWDTSSSLGEGVGGAAIGASPSTNQSIWSTCT